MTYRTILLQLTDDAGNEHIVFRKTASAVNQIGVTNAATGNAPLIAAEGGDANIDLQLAGTDQRLTPVTFQVYRRENKLAVAYAIPEEDVRLALAAPFVMLGSDGILEPGDNEHPRAAGTFARTLGRYVREEKVLTLREALAKMTVLPAKRLEKHAPALRAKGRLRVGMDADITIFDPDTVRDRATVANPAQYSEGIDWVIVGGQVVKDPRGLRRDVRPGRPIRSDLGGRAQPAAP